MKDAWTEEELIAEHLEVDEPKTLGERNYYTNPERRLLLRLIRRFQEEFLKTKYLDYKSMKHKI